MPLARLCRDCGTPALTTRCDACQAQHGAPRKAYKAERYGAAYRNARKQWAPIVANGGVPCARDCGANVDSSAWDLDHHPERGLWPAHPACNRSAQ